jgi:protein-disulfide isomerase
MSSDSKFFSIVAVAAVAVIAGVIWWSGSHKDIAVVDASVGQKRGPDNAPVKIIEFGDFQCPACQAAEADMRKMIAAHPDDVQFVFRHFPLGIHPNAAPAAQASEAASNQGKFWEMHDLIYDNQSFWSTQTNPESTFVSYAKQLGLDEKKFRDDYGSDAVKNIIKRDQDYGDSLAVNQTPTFYVNGQKLAGAQTFDQWQSLIEDAKK